MVEKKTPLEFLPKICLKEIVEEIFLFLFEARLYVKKPTQLRRTVEYENNLSFVIKFLPLL